MGVTSSPKRRCTQTQNHLRENFLSHQPPIVLLTCLEYNKRYWSLRSTTSTNTAFYYVDHAILTVKLCRRGVPSCLLGIINNWHGKLSAVVRWNHVNSAEFRIFSGVRQGDVLSPVLFNL